MRVRVRLEDGGRGEFRQQPLPLAASPVLTRVGVTKARGPAPAETVPPLPRGGRSDSHAAHLTRSEDSRSLQGRGQLPRPILAVQLLAPRGGGLPRLLFHPG